MKIERSFRRIQNKELGKLPALYFFSKFPRQARAKNNQQSIRQKVNCFGLKIEMYYF